MNVLIESYPQFSSPGIIEKFRFLPGDTSGSSKVYQILPDGYFDLVFVLSDTQCKIRLAGPYTQKALVPLDNIEIFAIRFRLGQIPFLMDIHSSELVNKMVQIDHVFGMRSEHICEILLKNKEVGAKQKTIEALIQKHHIKLMTQSRIYRRAASIIEAYGGHIKVHEIADILGISVRTLERHFVQILGFPPKQFIRIVRFQQAVEKLHKVNKSRSLTDISYECGYFDQSHFIKDFKTFYGDSPLFFKK